MTDLTHYAEMDAKTAHHYDADITDDLIGRLFSKAVGIRSNDISPQDRDAYEAKFREAYEEKPWEERTEAESEVEYL